MKRKSRPMKKVSDLSEEEVNRIRRSLKRKDWSKAICARKFR